MHLLCDIGTSNFRAIVEGKDLIVNEPCVMARDKQNSLTIGTQAQLMMGRNSDSLEIFSPVEAGGIRNIEAVVEVIRYCADRLTSSRLVRKFTITLSAPWGLTQVEKQAIEDAAKLAGARRVQIVNASVAAALGADLPVDKPAGYVVVNLGGGVTEVALLSMRGIVACQAIRSGGQALNLAIVDRVRKDYCFLMGLQTTETLKRQLCQDTELSGIEVRGRDLTSGLPRSLFVPRSVVDEQMVAYSEMIIELVGQVITECPPELVGDIMQHGMVLVGGGANCTSVVDRLMDRLDVPVVPADDPDTRVVEGLLKVQMADGERSKLDRRRWA